MEEDKATNFMFAFFLVCMKNDQAVNRVQHGGNYVVFVEWMVRFY